jgi:hypothetical protein
VLIASSVASVVKAIADDQDKQFLQTLTITGLSLPNAFYDSIENDIRTISGRYGYSSHARCHHTHDGLTCFVDPSPTQPHVDVVLNKFEVAQIFANNKRNIDNTDFVESILDQKVDPSHLSEDFKDKLGILGIHTFYDICRRFPDQYNYDDKFGIKIFYDQDGRLDHLSLLPEEIKKVEPGDAIRVFPIFEQIYAEKIKATVHSDCPAT